jgi:hypothetical protein
MPDAGLDKIERDLAREREALAASLAALEARLGLRSLVAEGKAALRARARPALAAADAAIRARPVALAVAGAALAALVLGRKAARPAEDAADPPALAGTRYEALSRWEGEGGTAAPALPDPDEHWLAEALALRSAAAALLHQAEDAARRGLIPQADLARHRADIIAALGRDTAAALGQGLGSLPEEARPAAVEARERRYLARVAAVGGERDPVGPPPLVTSVVAAGLGAAIACLLPRTEAEDALLGAARDRLADEAVAVLRDEAVKLSDFARVLHEALQGDLDRAAAAFAPTEGRAPPGEQTHQA